MMPDYPIPAGMHAVTGEDLDSRDDSEIDRDLLHPPPVRDSKNVWFF